MRSVIGSIFGLVQVAVEFPNTITANAGTPFTGERRGEILVGPFPAEAASHIGQTLFKKTFGFRFGELCFSPARSGPRVDALCPPHRGINAIVTRDADWPPIAIAVIKHKLWRVPILADCQTRNSAYFLAVDKHQTVA